MFPLPLPTPTSRLRCPLPSQKGRLSPPSILLLPTLRRLALKDTHLGDERWGTVAPRCRLEVLDLGACAHVEEAVNSACTARIVGAVGDSLSEVGIGSAIGGADEDAVPSPVATSPKQQQRRHDTIPCFAAPPAH